jgi:transcriptional regulator with XRE-family HTH domain
LSINILIDRQKNLKMTIGDRIKIIRGKLSQKEFAQKIDPKKKSVTEWESGVAMPGAASLESIHRVFGVNINWLLTGEGDRYIKLEESENRPALQEETLEYQKSTSTLGKAVDMLATVLNSGNQVFIQALMSNLIAFSNAVQTDQNQRQEIAIIKSELEQVRARLTALEESPHQHQEPAPSAPENTEEKAM